MKTISRRQMLTAATGLTIGGGLLAIHESQGQVDEEKAIKVSTAKTNPFSIDAEEMWYAPIVAQKAADRTYEFYPEGACMYAVIRGILSLVAEKESLVISPVFYNLFQYGHGGCGGWGSLCGACNGAAVVMGIFCHDKKNRDAMITKLFRWYESTLLPEYVPVGQDQTKKFPAAVAGSILCHVSADQWVETTEIKMFSPERKERCKRLAADVAKKTVEILNAQYVADKKSVNGKNAESISKMSVGQMGSPDSCIHCHSIPGGKPDSYTAKAPKTITKMDCAKCHAMSPNHPEMKGSQFLK